MEQLKYIVEDSTIAEILGVQNFSTKEAAVLELVKNAYDAQANNLIIVISPTEIVLTDDGVGMTLDTIRTHWMHVGKSPKGYNEFGRVMAGSKGIGRFALARLGKKVSIDSRKVDNVTIRWKTDWNTSTVENISLKMPIGTSICISGLRDKWSKQNVAQLTDFLSRACAQEEMRIEVQFEGEKIFILNQLSGLLVGRDYVWRIELKYDSSLQRLDYVFHGDEFLKTAQSFCGTDISYYIFSINMADELSAENNFSEREDIRASLTAVGDFSATLYFQNNPASIDVEKFLYKKHSGLARKNSGIILYRNAFSIAGYEGNRDWLELGKRSRKSPAAASHPTGAWRVRENQMLGRVGIDKKENEVLTDLSNRQGMEENVFYELFVSIIIAGISHFERYRQSIIRAIDKKNKVEATKKNSPLINLVLSNPKEIASLDNVEQRNLAKEILNERQQSRHEKNSWEENEQRYKYDIRLLNILATLGLRSSSMAHEMNNDRSAIVTNCENIINALIRYGYWEDLSSPEKTKVQHRNIPALLEISQKVEAKMVSFMDVMLTEIEKQKFKPMLNNVYSVIVDIVKKWKADYAKLEIKIIGEENTQFWIAEDIIISILDNLILNSVQQNDQRGTIKITLCFRNETDRLWFSYADDGVGLAQKYRTDPTRILEVHETTREKGHGLGMWIVNNSIHYTGGEVLLIDGNNGFKFEFELGRDV